MRSTAATRNRMATNIHPHTDREGPTSITQRRAAAAHHIMARMGRPTNCEPPFSLPSMPRNCWGAKFRAPHAEDGSLRCQRHQTSRTFDVRFLCKARIFRSSCRASSKEQYCSPAFSLGYRMASAFASNHPGGPGQLYGPSCMMYLEISKFALVIHDLVMLSASLFEWEIV